MRYDANDNTVDTASQRVSAGLEKFLNKMKRNEIKRYFRGTGKFVIAVVHLSAAQMAKMSVFCCRWHQALRRCKTQMLCTFFLKFCTALTPSVLLKSSRGRYSR